MAVNYLKAPWKWHVELFLKDNMGEPLLPVGDIRAMLNDSFGMHELSPSPNDDE